MKSKIKWVLYQVVAGQLSPEFQLAMGAQSQIVMTRSVITSSNLSEEDPLHHKQRRSACVRTILPLAFALGHSHSDRNVVAQVPARVDQACVLAVLRDEQPLVGRKRHAIAGKVQRHALIAIMRNTLLVRDRQTSSGKMTIDW